MAEPTPLPPLPPGLVDILHFVVYIKTDEHFLIQLSHKCLLNFNCEEEAGEVTVEL